MKFKQLFAINIANKEFLCQFPLYSSIGYIMCFAVLIVSSQVHITISNVHRFVSDALLIPFREILNLHPENTCSLPEWYSFFSWSAFVTLWLHAQNPSRSLGAFWVFPGRLKLPVIERVGEVVVLQRNTERWMWITVFWRNANFTWMASNSVLNFWRKKLTKTLI